jgi:hypothetical protein
MLKLKNSDLAVTRVEARAAVPQQDDSSPIVKCRIGLELPVSNDQIKTIPFVAAAVRAIVKASQKVDEGPNSYALTVKRDFGHASYHLSMGDRSASFSGDVALRPKVAIAEGEVAVAWKVDTEIDLEDLSDLCAMVHMDGVLCTSKVTQKVIPFDGGTKKQDRSNASSDEQASAANGG